ncbi:MAG: winged helix-turn-helix transcriptional regulator, partial [Sphingomonas bacterium]|nr:winged helix-turn-helix transcriptional regulator [Sphingomonas bacterium]
MDATDLKILALLQDNALLTLAEVATEVNLSPTPCWRRIAKLESSGVIERRVALLDAAKV